MGKSKFIITSVDGTINRNKYIKILENNLWPVIVHFHDEHYMFQKDNAHIHRVRDVENYKARNHINSNSWPAQSTDLNINENVWLKLKRRLQSRDKTSGLQLNFPMRSSLTVDYIQSLYRSLPRRMRERSSEWG